MIHTVIDKYINEIKKINLETIMRPVSVLQQREQEYVRKREMNVPFLKYEYPNVQNTCVDFLVNGKKVQEKIAGLNTSKNILHIGLRCNNGKIDKKRAFRSYHLGQNDVYWFHSSIDDRFWIVPEMVLYEHGHISDPKNPDIKSKVSLNFVNSNSNHKWIDDYEFSYSNVNRDAIMKLFE